MSVVSNTSPLHYLILIERTELLPALFDSIHIPPSVVDELSQPSTPSAVRGWFRSPPPWLRVTTPRAENLAFPTLGRGERDAIQLALDMKAKLTLIDDREAVAAARQSDLLVTGTLGILDRAARAGLVSLPAELNRLLLTTFRARPSLVLQILDDHRRFRS